MKHSARVHFARQQAYAQHDPTVDHVIILSSWDMWAYDSIRLSTSLSLSDDLSQHRCVAVVLASSCALLCLQTIADQQHQLQSLRNEARNTRHELELHQQQARDDQVRNLGIEACQDIFAAQQEQCCIQCRHHKCVCVCSVTVLYILVSRPAAHITPR